MRKIIAILLLCVPAFAWAQLSAPTADYALPTTGLTGDYDYIYVFYDQATMSLTATQPNGHNAEFTWKKLNVPAVSLDLYHQESGVTSSIIDIEEGGYQVTVLDLDDLTTPVDTFTTWVFRDIFRIESVSCLDNDCAIMHLSVLTTPDFYTSYAIYNFQQFLTPPHIGRTNLALVQSAEWTPVNGAGQEIDIFPNIENPDNSWRTSRNKSVFIHNPPPLVNAAYRLEVTNVFGRSASYTTPIINAVATRAISTIEEYNKENNSWRDAGELPEGEALYELRFKHDKSINANHYEWTGFANARQANGDRTVVWQESTTNANAEVKPQMPHNGKLYEGYTPGSYQVRLTVSNNNGCVDTDTIKYIVVEPSAFDTQAIPNAFTPNGDNQNDIFTFVKGQEPISMEYIYVYIYNRSGGLVYRYEGRFDAWEGWDGRMMGTGSNVPEGVYFYVISGTGWDDITYNTKEYSGYLHLFR